MASITVSVIQPTPLTARLPPSPSKNGISKPLSLSVDSGLGIDARPGSVRPNLSIIEVEQLIRDQVKEKYRELLQAFQTYDVDKTHSVTKGEFKRVLELFCSLSADQFTAILTKVETNRNGTIKYRDFLNKFYGQDCKAGRVGSRAGARTAPHFSNQLRSTPRLLTPIPQSDVEDYDEIEASLREKITRNLKTVLKALRLFDYVGDRKIQRHELQKVLENYCFKMSPKILSRLWQRTDSGNIVDYHEFLRRLGVGVDRRHTQLPDSAAASMNWPQKEDRSTIKPGVNRGQGLERHSINFFELEQEFRKKMKENYALLIKAFLSFDATRDGYVTLDQLRAVLNQFTVPMSEDVFEELMMRCAVKATGRVAWMTFVERFQDPISTTNGSTLPIKSRVKCNPHQGVGHTAQLRELVSLIHEHVNTNFSSFSAAFLKIDKNRNGKISRSEMRRVMDRFKLSISEEQFRELMQVLDPEHSGFVSYHAFLEMFEPRETKEGHKWLKSMHRYNDHQKPAILAWATVEDLLNQRLTEHWKAVESAIHRTDPKGSGFMPPAVLKRIIDREGLPTSKEHFEYLLSRLPPRGDAQGRVCYLDLLALLGVEGRPGDLAGLSQQISDTHDADRERRESEHRARMDKMAAHAQSRTEAIPEEELLVRLRDRMAQNRFELRDAFLQVDPDRRGFVRRSQLKKIFEGYGLLMSDAQFDAVAARLGLEQRKDVMDYRKFVESFGDPRTGQNDSAVGVFLPKSNHHVNAIRGDEFGMTAEQVEAKLREKLRDNFTHLREAFHKFDDDNQGRLSKNNFRRMLDSTMCVLSDDEFELLCERLGVSDRKKIDYPTFLEMFEVRDSLKDGHKWLVSDHRFNPERPMRAMGVAEVQAMLAEKVHQYYQDVARAFCHIDDRGRGLITRKEFRLLLGKFNINMEPDQFKLLWKHYDPAGRGAISHDMFLKRVGVAAEFTSGDQGGPSEKIIRDSHDTVAEHLEKQQAIQEQMTFNQAVLGTHLDCSQVYAALRARVRDDFKDTYLAFKQYDKEGKGYLTHNDIQAMLSDLHLFINDKQFEDLMEHLGIDGKNRQLTYSKFCTVFDEDMRGPNQGAVPMEHNLRFLDDGGVGPAEAEKKLRSVVTGQFDVMRKAFLAFDEPRKGTIAVADFHRILDNFCFKMSASNFKHILSKCNMKGEGLVDYVGFLNTFNLTADENKLSAVDMISSAEASQWLMQNKVDHTQTSAEPKLEPADVTLTSDLNETPGRTLSSQEISECLYEIVRARPQLLRADFEAADYAGLGVVAKSDFREILHRHVMRVTDQQFESLWPHLLPVNEFGNLNYRELFAEDERAIRKEDAAKEMQDKAEEQKAKEIEEGRPMESRLMELCRRQWRNVFARCKEIDANDGELTIAQFSQILRGFGLQATVKELAPLLRRYGLHGETGLFRYQDLLRSLVLHTPKTEPVQVIKQKMNKAHIPLKSRGEESRDLFPCMHRIRDRVLADWKEMRREFKSMDTSGNGQISASQLRRAFTKFGLRLNEDEFYNVMTHYDRELRGAIDYNDFLKSFLSSA